MTKEQAEELLQSSSTQTRTNTEPSANDSSPAVQDAIRDAYKEILDGDASSNLTIRDENLTALARGLDEADALGGVMEQASEALGRDHNEASVSRSQTLALLVRVGLQEVDSSLMETAMDAREEYRASKNTEF